MQINSSDLLMYIQSISREKELSNEQVLDIFAEALALSLNKTNAEYRNADFRVEIDPKSGDTETYRRWRVIGDDELLENPDSELMLESAQLKKDDADVGDIIEELIEGVDFDRRAAVVAAKQCLNMRLRDAERQRLLDELLERKENLVSGQVLRILRTTGDAIVEVHRVECRLPKREMIPRESLKTGDRVQALIKEVDHEARNPLVVLTRISPDFLSALFQRVVPEIEKGALEIVSAVRDPGNRAKIAVRSHNSRVDPIGTCVGIRGSRVQAVTNELNGERIDIIPWEEDDVKFVLKALAPAEISKIKVDRERGVMDVLAEPHLLAQAIGKNGVNARLASELTKWKLVLHAPEDYMADLEKETARKSTELAKVLSLDEDVARILCEEGFETLEHVAYVPEEDLLSIEGFKPEMVSEIQERAREIAEKEEAETREKMERMEAALLEIIGAEEDFPRLLAKGDILSLQDLADLATDELCELLGIAENDTKQTERGSHMIMQARKIAYNLEDVQG